MPFLSVALVVDASRADTFSDALLAAGALAVETADGAAGTPGERALFAEPGAACDPEWQITQVSALFSDEMDVRASVSQALRAAVLDPQSSYTVDEIADQDWVRTTQSQFAPVRISASLWVVPTWHTPPDPAAVNLIIDPGLAFGTGTHPTTRLCLRWLENRVRGGESVLDYGCGSGILAIAAMKLGAARAIAVDVEAGALLAARHNAMQNQTAVEFTNPDGASGAVADIVVANILARPLQLLAPVLARSTAERGAIALSGILETQVDAVCSAYREWFDLAPVQIDEGWVLLTGVRRQEKIAR